MGKGPRTGDGANVAEYSDMKRCITGTIQDWSLRKLKFDIDGGALPTSQHGAIEAKICVYTRDYELKGSSEWLDNLAFQCTVYYISDFNDTACGYQQRSHSILPRLSAARCVVPMESEGEDDRHLRTRDLLHRLRVNDDERALALALRRRSV